MVDIILEGFHVYLPMALLALAVAALVLLIILARRNPLVLQAELKASFRAIDQRLDDSERVLREELGRSRQESAFGDRQAREEMRATLGHLTDSILNRMTQIARLQKDQLDSFSKQLADLTRLNEGKLDALRLTMENRLQSMQASNTEKLDQMRNVVDEKLQSTLEKRLGESFKQVSERLEQVYTGLGEMRSLAAGVGDLKKVLTNVKTRGTWGEIRLSHILEQILTPEQYAVNVVTRRGGTERVEFAIRLPGQDDAAEGVVWLPIDAKFPQEDYQRLLDAQAAADKEAADRALKSLEQRVKLEARIDPRKIHRPAPHHGFRHPVRAGGRPVCRGAEDPRVVRHSAARAPHCGHRPHHPGGALEQPADGLPDAGDRQALKRGVGTLGQCEDRVRKVRRHPGQDQEEAPGGDPHDRPGGSADAGHRTQPAAGGGDTAR